MSEERGEEQLRRGVKRGILIAVGCLAALILIGVVAIVRMGKEANEALASQVNEEIDMNKISDGIYYGSSDAGFVSVEVSVTVKEHKIAAINLLKHNNGKGKPAEAMLNEMVKANTYDVDVVSGATVSSKTIKNAVNKALQQGVAKSKKEGEK